MGQGLLKRSAGAAGELFPALMHCCPRDLHQLLFIGGVLPGSRHTSGEDQIVGEVKSSDHFRLVGLKYRDGRVGIFSSAVFHGQIELGI